MTKNIRKQILRLYNDDFLTRTEPMGYRKNGAWLYSVFYEDKNLTIEHYFTDLEVY